MKSIKHIFGTRRHITRAPETFGERFKMFLKEWFVFTLVIMVLGFGLSMSIQ